MLCNAMCHVCHFLFSTLPFEPSVTTAAGQVRAHPISIMFDRCLAHPELQHPLHILLVHGLGLVQTLPVDSSSAVICREEQTAHTRLGLNLLKPRTSTSSGGALRAASTRMGHPCARRRPQSRTDTPALLKVVLPPRRTAFK